ncbi:tyrosine-type recombinase/integrase [Paenibacillus pseudetheri]|nr:tyrosine-type recombinase/integrase [Paenibacillus pseudetheri]
MKKELFLKTTAMIAQNSVRFFFHELCHVIRHSGDQRWMPDLFREAQEIDADRFALYATIPFFMLDQITLPIHRSEAISLLALEFHAYPELVDQALTPRTIKSFYADLRKKYSKDYVKNIHGVLKRALRLAYSESGLLAEDIMSKVSMRSKINANEQKEMQFWTIEDFTQFLNSSKYHVHYIVFSLAIHTRWGDIDFEKKELKVIQTANWTRDGLVIQRPKTNDSIRRVKLFQNIMNDLKERYSQIEAYKKEYEDSYEDNDLVCCYPGGGYIKPKRITDGMDVLVRKAGVKKVRFHDQRHTHASFLLGIGINPKVAAERLGMTPAMFNERYSTPTPNHAGRGR